MKQRIGAIKVIWKEIWLPKGKKKMVKKKW